VISREELRSIEPPQSTLTWQPIKHARLVDVIHQELAFREIMVVKEEHAVQRDGHYLFAAMVLNWLNTGTFAAALAFRHSNDRKEAMTIYAGMHVFVCDSATRSI
jgi:hypothetical protein